MLNNPHTDPPAQAPNGRRNELKYLERFVRWARKLNDDDLTMVVAFCANVQMAWNDGQEKAKTAAEQVEQGTALPGLGAPFAADIDTGIAPDGRVYQGGNPDASN